MWTKSYNLEVVALLVLIFIPWPGPTIFKISCPRESATVVRKVVQKKWIPILEKRSVQLGVECPFHPTRDIFGTQQAAKQQHRASQWTCAFCGKSFYTERHLDSHFDSRHRDTINVAEDAVCLADFCDVMRCEVVAERAEAAAARGGTDMEVWQHRTALSVSPPRDLARLHKAAAIPSLKAPSSRQQQSARCPPASSSPRTPPPASGPTARGEASSPSSPSPPPTPRDGDANATADDVCANKADLLVDSSLPPHQARAQEMQRLKADCKPEELLKLKTRCEILVRDCIAGLLVNLSVQDFKEIEAELNRVSCWYLTCDRYWEDSPATDRRASPWALLGFMCTTLAVGVFVCYYIIWVLFDSDEAGCDSPVGNPPMRHNPYYQADLDGSEQYIYVSYPPDLKRRLLERNTNPLAPSNGRPISAPPSSGLGPPAAHQGQQPQQPQQLQTLQLQQHQQQQHHHHHQGLYHRPAMSTGVQQQQHYQQLARANAAAQLRQQHQQLEDPFEREWKI